jgi:hypothetical protein
MDDVHKCDNYMNILSSQTYKSYCSYCLNYTSRDSVVGIATAYDLADQGVGVRVPIG